MSSRTDKVRTGSRPGATIDGLSFEPSHSFLRDLSTGMYLRAPGELGFTAGGVNRFFIAGDLFRSELNTGPAIVNRNATGSVPALLPDLGDDDTGIGSVAANKLSLIAGGVEVIRIDGVGATKITSFEGQVNIGQGTGAPAGNALVVVGPQGANVGGLATGQLQIRTTDTSVNGAAVITGHNSSSGNTQVWYLGGTSGSNKHIAFINRQEGEFQIWTNNASRVVVNPHGGLRLVGTGGFLTMPSLTTAQRDNVPGPIRNGDMLYNTSVSKFQMIIAGAWVDIA